MTHIVRFIGLLLLNASSLRGRLVSGIQNSVSTQSNKKPAPLRGFFYARSEALKKRQGPKP